MHEPVANSDKANVEKYEFQNLGGSTGCSYDNSLNFSVSNFSLKSWRNGQCRHKKTPFSFKFIKTVLYVYLKIKSNNNSDLHT